MNATVAPYRQEKVIYNPSLRNNKAPTLSKIGQRISIQHIIKSRSNAHLLLEPGIPCLRSFPWQQWQQHLSSAGKKMRYLLRAEEEGYFPLRKEIANHLCATRGLNCSPEQVLICSGSQQGLHLALSLLLDENETIFTEDPGFQGIDNCLAMIGAKKIATPVDEQGFCLKKSLEKHPKTRIALITPSRNFPLGYTLSLERRLKLLQWAENTDSWIIEDDYDSAFRFHGPPLTSLQGLGGKHCVIYTGSFSRVLHPSVRLGYLVLPPSLVQPFTQAKKITEGGLPLLPQIALSEFISSGHFTSHIRRMCKLYKHRKSFLHQAVSIELKNILQPVNSDGGLHSTFILPEPEFDVII